MLEAGVSGLPVLDTEGSLIGVVTEAHLVAEEGAPWSSPFSRSVDELAQRHG
jgi:CBS domain-containing protein